MYPRGASNKRTRWCMAREGSMASRFGIEEASDGRRSEALDLSRKVRRHKIVQGIEKTPETQCHIGAEAQAATTKAKTLDF